MKPTGYLLAFALIFSGFPNKLSAQTFDSLWAVQLQNSLNTIATSSDIKGVSAAVYMPGQGTWTGAAGISEPGVPATPDMRFGIGSNTKLFTAVALLKLQEQGVLSLDDSLGMWLPTYAYVNPATTIRQLLSHQGGIFDFINDNASLWYDSLWVDENRFWTAEEVLATIGPEEFEVGRGFAYSNTGYLVAGMAMEAATGKTWAQNVRELILDPHGLEETFAGAWEAPNGPVAIEWRNTVTPMLNTPMVSLYSLTHAAGALLSTGADMTHWYNALFTGNVLTPASMKELLDFEPTSLYALGITTQYYNIPPEAPIVVLTHGGSMVGFNSLTFFDPKTGISAFFVSNITLVSVAPFNTFIFSIYENFPKKSIDAGIVDVAKPWATVCGDSVAPSVELRNFGTDTLFSAQIQYGVADGALATYNWTGTLMATTSINLDLPAISVSGGPHEMVCFTTLSNGAAEGYNHNDTARSRFLVKELASDVFPLSENFDSSATFPPDGWSVNSDNLYNWGRTRLASSSGLYSMAQANYLDPYVGAKHDVELPVVDCSNLTDATLSFHYAYTYYPGYFDSLRVQFSEDCGTTWQNLFYRGGVKLSTAAPTTNFFYPLPHQWNSIDIPMNTTASEVLIRFRSINDYGNNLYVDDIQVWDDIQVAAAEPETSEGFDLYPNPATNSLWTTGLPPAVDYTITDISGKQVMRGVTGNNDASINVGHLAPGFYVFQTALGARKWVKM